jgi:RNA polymerase sigma-70 factor, ECF subfamily
MAKEDYRRSSFRSTGVTNVPPERCINVSTSGLVTTYPSTPSVTAGAVEQSSLTVSTLFDLHANGLYRLALAMLHEADAAQDVVQDTFVRLIAHLEGGGTLPNARGWLYTVAAHACRDRQRRLGRWLPWIAERDTRQAAETPDFRDATQATLDAIRALAPRDRLLVALRAQGLSYREIGDAAGIRATSVGRLLARALDRLQAQLEQRR